MKQTRHTPEQVIRKLRDAERMLAEVPLAKLAAVTGLSKGQCSSIRRGLKIPHPRHWDSLRKL